MPGLLHVCACCTQTCADHILGSCLLTAYVLWYVPVQLCNLDCQTSASGNQLNDTSFEVGMMPCFSCHPAAAVQFVLKQIPVFPVCILFGPLFCLPPLQLLLPCAQTSFLNLCVIILTDPVLCLRPSRIILLVSVHLCRFVAWIQWLTCLCCTSPNVGQQLSNHHMTDMHKDRHMRCNLLVVSLGYGCQHACVCMPWQRFAITLALVGLQCIAAGLHCPASIVHLPSCWLCCNSFPPLPSFQCTE